LQAGNFNAMATPYPEPLDDEGNLWIHEQGSFAGAPFLMRDAGKIIDISGTPLFFEVAGIRKAFTAHPTDAKGRWFPALTVLECESIPDGARYVIWDESDGGKIPVFGAKLRRFQ
jgi:hypothetical protein